MTRNRIIFSLAILILPLSFLLSQVDDVSIDKFYLTIEGNTLKIPYYSNQDIYDQNDNMDKVVILIQGSNRNAGPYLDNLKIAANNDPLHTQNTLLITPQFLIEDDIDHHNLDSEHLYWTNGGWKSGSNSRDEISNPRPVRIPSYAVLDHLIIHLIETYPNLNSIVLAGHSAGGQFVQRFAATSTLPEQLCNDMEVSIRFVPMNPSSYVYMNAQRRISGSMTDFSIPITSCSAYNEWKYGLEDLYTYAKDLGAVAIRNQYKNRNVTYLVGEEDDNPNSSSLDDSCEGNLQGNHRLERGKIYFNYMKYFYGAEIESTHNFSVVPGAGHNSLEMMDSPIGRFNLFENTKSNCGSSVATIDHQSAKNLLIHPNPNNGIFTISGINFDNDGNAVINIYDAFGQWIASPSLDSNQMINVSTLNSGLYIIQLKSEETSITKRIIINAD